MMLEKGTCDCDLFIRYDLKVRRWMIHARLEVWRWYWEVMWEHTEKKLGE